jgi:Protein of unknown function (DUF3012)
MKRGWRALCTLLGIALASAACAPETGSEAWCEMMRGKPRGDWTANEALDFAKHCLLD